MLSRRGSRRIRRCSCHEKEVNQHKNLLRYSFVPSSNPRPRARYRVLFPSRRHRCRYLFVKSVIYNRAPYRPPLSYKQTATPKPRIPFQNKESMSDAAVGGDLVHGFKRGGEGVSAPAWVDSRAQPGATLAVRDFPSSLGAGREAKERPRRMGSSLWRVVKKTGLDSLVLSARFREKLRRCLLCC